MTETTLWTQCLAAFNDVLSEKQMKTWFHPLEVEQISNTLKVVAPNKYVRDEIEGHYMVLIKETVIHKSENKVSEVLLSLPELKQEPKAKQEVKIKISNNLNKDLIFENFVEGKSNQLAKAACVSVVKQLGQYLSLIHI